MVVDTGAREASDFPDVVGSFGLCRSGRLAVPQRHHVVLFDPKSGKLTDLTAKIAERPDQPAERPQGRVRPRVLSQQHGWEFARQKTAALYRVTADGQITKQEDGYAVSNGLAWSPNGRTLYHSDSTAGIIGPWDFDLATDDRTHHRILAKLTNDNGRPDGAASNEDGPPVGGATDAAGNYWSAGPFAGCINCFSPNGEPLRKWAFPLPRPPVPCFAGDSQ
jgi:sugar lactone lactonase YvrE